MRNFVKNVFSQNSQILSSSVLKNCLNPSFLCRTFHPVTFKNHACYSSNFENTSVPTLIRREFSNQNDEMIFSYDRKFIDNLKLDVENAKAIWISINEKAISQNIDSLYRTEYLEPNEMKESILEYFGNVEKYYFDEILSEVQKDETTKFFHESDNKIDFEMELRKEENGMLIRFENNGLKSDSLVAEAANRAIHLINEIHDNNDKFDFDLFAKENNEVHDLEIFCYPVIGNGDNNCKNLAKLTDENIKNIIVKLKCEEIYQDCSIYQKELGKFFSDSYGNDIIRFKGFDPEFQESNGKETKELKVKFSDSLKSSTIVNCLNGYKFPDSEVFLDLVYDSGDNDDDDDDSGDGGDDSGGGDDDDDKNSGKGLGGVACVVGSMFSSILIIVYYEFYGDKEKKKLMKKEKEFKDEIAKLMKKEKELKDEIAKLKKYINFITNEFCKKEREYQRVISNLNREKSVESNTVHRKGQKISQYLRILLGFIVGFVIGIIIGNM